MTNFNVGDRIRTPSNRSGVIQSPPWTMPLHQFVQLDSHDCPIWLLTSILTPEVHAQPSPSPVAQLDLFTEVAA